ncbi:MAG: hypothetical protein COC02_05055 [Rhodospirillaceae bacterium]|jgi:hypothetical protein|nr:MAG: hypothetical protein COC02_05055 [Rhodospirillaceae bacterium]
MEDIKEFEYLEIKETRIVPISPPSLGWFKEEIDRYEISPQLRGRMLYQIKNPKREENMIGEISDIYAKRNPLKLPVNPRLIIAREIRGSLTEEDFDKAQSTYCLNSNNLKMDSTYYLNRCR